MSAGPLKNGQYRTEAGSLVNISGEHSGIHSIIFDWVEEKACPAAIDKPWVDILSHRLCWSCDCHGVREAELRFDYESIIERLIEAAEPFAALSDAAFPVNPHPRREGNLLEMIIYSYRDSQTDTDHRVTVPQIRELALARKAALDAIAAQKEAS